MPSTPSILVLHIGLGTHLSAGATTYLRAGQRMGHLQLAWRAQRAVGPFAAGRILKGGLLAIRADIALLTRLAPYDLHRLTAHRARLPDGIPRRHLNFPAPTA